ncbi:ABC transporter substrate-binding protein [Paenibacillus arenilitoris]|uniref:Carbohydrate ABC transporter substrate-binding protein n=1 Tax=Paenibacillus arenilitoris TaxID=2772299 RepID=A0A927H787_9BACL|nr:ABC transporter substrate-binding protein [Paenibacillus arenilitoris]MBD2871351.1 carbohydrate ABC transporter substrate-binding protein [Paenibacillus arenilitoris]
MVKRKAWQSGALVLMCAAMTACSGGKTDDGAGEAPPVSEDAPAADGRTAVTMSVLTKDRFLTEAEQKFEAANPDIDVQIEEIVPADTSGGDKMMIRKGPGTEEGPKKEDVDKYASSVNTAIMSGNAADIISVEYLPVGKYADKGLLADWNALVGADASFNKSEYYENVFAAVSNGGGWYGIPTSFSLSAMLGDLSLLEQNGLDEKTWTWDQFVELIEQTSTDGKFGIAAMEPEALLGYLAESLYGQLVKKDGDAAAFDAGLFQTYMEKIKHLYDGGFATKEMMGPANASFRQAGMASPMDAAIMPQAGGGEPQDMIRPPGTGEDEGIPFKSGQVLGLNAKSEVKDAAWSFVKFLLSEEMQSSRALMNFPVNKAALGNKLTETKEMLANSGSGGGEGKGPSIMLRNKDGETITPTLTDEDVEKIKSLMPSVGKYSNQDPKVMSMIAEESAAYFSGSKSAEAVAGTLASRINTYLNE